MAWQLIELNSDSSRMSIIDINGVLTFFDFGIEKASPGADVAGFSLGKAGLRGVRYPLRALVPHLVLLAQGSWCRCGRGFRLPMRCAAQGSVVTSTL